MQQNDTVSSPAQAAGSDAARPRWATAYSCNPYGESCCSFKQTRVAVQGRGRAAELERVLSEESRRREEAEEGLSGARAEITRLRDGPSPTF